MKRLNITLLLTASCFFAVAQNAVKTGTFSFIAFGDMPYTLPQDYPRFENVIKTINAQNSVFTVDVGDIKSSSTPCSEESYGKILGYFQQFNKPLVYTPGDNEWTDCGKKDAGAYEPEERLEVLRKLFFKERASFGKEKVALTSQSQNPLYSKFVENNRWDYGNISFATVHVVGTNNNFVPVSKNGNQEFYEREKADLAWIEETFDDAKKKNNIAVVIVLHADMFSGKDMKDGSGFNSFKEKLKSLVIDFKKPVLLINGDSHILVLDKPFYEDSKLKKAVGNFTRLQVPGEVNMHAVKISVNPASPSLFQFEELQVPGN